MVSVEDIGWASYGGYEGPFFRGNAPFRMPEEPTEAERRMRVITATEGGNYNSYNGYDKCDCTLGLIQWCDHGQYSVCDMLGYTADRDPVLIQPLEEWCERIGVTFKKNHRGRWRYFFLDSRGEVDRTSEQDQLYHLNSTGHVGTWDPESRTHAKKFAATLATIYLDERAQSAQVDFTVARLEWFVAKSVRDIWEGAPADELGRAFQAAFLSYAANNPSWAARWLRHADTTYRGSERYSLGWLCHVLKNLTFGPAIAIYPHRYNAIRPVLEKLYGIDLPDMAKELGEWVRANGRPVAVQEIQRHLDALGYDLGPSGIDGVIGKKTRAALRTFQALVGLEQTGYPDPATRDALTTAVEALSSMKTSVESAEMRRVEQAIAASLARAARAAVREAVRTRGSPP